MPAARSSIEYNAGRLGKAEMIDGPSGREALKPLQRRPDTGTKKPRTMPGLLSC